MSSPASTMVSLSHALLMDPEKGPFHPQRDAQELLDILQIYGGMPMMGSKDAFQKVPKGGRRER